MEYVYAEPIKDEIYRYPIQTNYFDPEGLVSFFVEVSGGLLSCYLLEDGSYFAPEIPPGVVWRETPEWVSRYQDSLSSRVSQHTVKVFFVETLKRGKNNSRVLVIDGLGHAFHMLVPTVPALRLGESIEALRLDLTVVSLAPIQELVQRVRDARDKDPLII